ncbi:MAG: hypothetical protein ACRETM_13935 [Stenotrophobium sp.]
MTIKRDPELSDLLRERPAYNEVILKLEAAGWQLWTKSELTAFQERMDNTGPSKCNGLFAVKVGNQIHYPNFQFDTRGELLDRMIKILEYCGKKYPCVGFAGLDGFAK